MAKEKLSFALERPHARAVRHLARRDDRTTAAYLRQVVLAEIRSRLNEDPQTTDDSDSSEAERG